jgi:hypothetical protein
VTWTADHLASDEPSRYRGDLDALVSEHSERYALTPEERPPLVLRTTHVPTGHVIEVAIPPAPDVKRQVRKPWWRFW